MSSLRADLWNRAAGPLRHPRAGAQLLAPSPVTAAIGRWCVLARCTAVFCVIATVAFMPRASGAQAAVPLQQTIRHTLISEVPIVTRTAISSHSRPGVAALRARLGDAATAQLAQRAWIATVDVRANVNASLVLEAGAPGANWQVLDASGQLVPWSTARVRLSAARAAGLFSVDVIWIAPDVTTPPPTGALLRVEPDGTR